MAIGIRILSDNLSGLTTNVTFLPQSGGTINIGEQVFPFNYISNYVYGIYNCFVPTYGYTYSLEVLEPAPTPTPTNTETPTNTPSPTPTNPTIINYYYSTDPLCISLDSFDNVVLDNDFCDSTTITSTTVLLDGTYWIGEGDIRRQITATSGSYSFIIDCVAC
jgi:hypothetical protein